MNPPAAFPTTLIVFACRAVVALGLLAVARAQPPGEAEEPPSRLGYSRNLMRGVNEADFRSAMTVYSRVIAQTYRIPTAPDIALMGTREEIETALRRGQVTIFAAPADEMLALPAELLDPTMLTSAVGGSAGVEYVLLAHVESEVRRVADLPGKTLIILDSVQGVLGAIWLQVAFAEAGLGVPAGTLRELRSTTKPALAALPVFFRQVDACVVTRAAFATLGELNPQLLQRLHVIDASPRVLPLLTAFRRGVDPRLRDRIVAVMFELKSTAAGRQLLTTFQTDGLVFCEPDTLAATRRLLATHAQLAARPAARPGPPP